MAIKVNEICVGDWVICNHYQDKPFTKQFGVADFAKGEYEFCKPIPLTEDILVKNGWRKEPITIDGDYANWNGEIPISQAEDEYNYADIELRYAHQLQHLLRLCGIDMEIKI